MNVVRMRGFVEQMSVDDALREYLKVLKMKTLQPEEIQIFDAFKRTLAQDVIAEIDVPHFERSAVDGYAVKAVDTFGASTSNPIVFDMIGVANVGQVLAISAGRSQAIRIATGAPLPIGADSVVMLEYTKIVGKGRIEIYSPITPGYNVSKRGEDVKRGERVLTRGTLLQPQDIGILVAIGVININVVRKPKVAILSTGDELIEPGSKFEVGKTVDVNRFILSASVKDIGGEPIDLGITRDEMKEIKLRISEGLSKADLILVSGGTSVGEGDLVPEVINSLGKPGVVVHGISMRPGKPTALAAIEGKPIILLPGFPVAAFMSFSTFVKPIMAKMLGVSMGKTRGQVINVKMIRRVPSTPGVKDFVRVVVKKTNSGYVAEPVRTKGAGIISSMVKANGLVVIPEEREGVEEGEEVDAVLLRPMKE